MLVEVMLIDSIIDDYNTKALVMFITHGDSGIAEQSELGPMLVPARWFSELMPMSIFLDIPSDASSISPVWNADNAQSPGSTPVTPGLGEQLAARWRANKRPIATTKEYVLKSYELAPAHLVSIGLDAIEALEFGRFNKAARGRIATYCELISRHIDSLNSAHKQAD
jgi:hypothetical protein